MLLTCKVCQRLQTLYFTRYTYVNWSLLFCVKKSELNNFRKPVSVQRISRWVGVGGAKSIVNSYVKQHANAWLWDAAIRVLDETLGVARRPTSAQSGQWNLKHWNTKKINSWCGVSVVWCQSPWQKCFFWDFMISWQLIVQRVVYSQRHMFKL